MLDIVELVVKHTKQIQEEIESYIEESPGNLDALVESIKTAMDVAPAGPQDAVASVTAIESSSHLAAVLFDLSKKTGDQKYQEKALELQAFFFSLADRANSAIGSN